MQIAVNSNWLDQLSKNQNTKKFMVDKTKRNNTYFLFDINSSWDGKLIFSPINLLLHKGVIKPTVFLSAHLSEYLWQPIIKSIIESILFCFYLCTSKGTKLPELFIWHYFAERYKLLRSAKVAMKQPNRKRKLSMDSKENVNQDGSLVRCQFLDSSSEFVLIVEIHPVIVEFV